MAVAAVRSKVLTSLLLVGSYVVSGNFVFVRFARQLFVPFLVWPSSKFGDCKGSTFKHRRSLDTSQLTMLQ